MQFVFVVTKNTDFTEGRGPMMLHKVFASFDDAHKYIQDQEGIFGSAQSKAADYGDKVTTWSYNGYGIKKMQIMTYETAHEDYQKQLKQTALAKLTDEEKIALGVKQ